MRTLFLPLLLFGFFNVNGQYVGPPNNVGRENGNPRMPLVVSHLAGANKERLNRAVRNSRHSIFGKVLCFRKLCRIQSGHPSTLRSISFKKFRKKVTKNAKKGLYKRSQSDSPSKGKQVVREVMPVVADTVIVSPPSESKGDSLIVLNAEFLFETDKSTLRRQHFEMLNSIVDYMVLHPERSVQISGHTDNTGSEDHNLFLSKKRADVVSGYLVTNGVDISRVVTFGFGSAKPLQSNTTSEGRKKNRRVELLISDQR
jgi:outer membrane protein OmpA-like peptidoglycan-associated protein